MLRAVKMVQFQNSLRVCQISLQDKPLTYRQAGNPGDRVPVLFLHGWGISGEPYYEILQLLAQDYPVLAPDLPGFAGSGEFGLIQTYSDYAELLLAWLQKLGIEQVHLVGHSLGGGIAITLAALAPSLVQSLVLVDSTGVPNGSVSEVLMRRAIEMPLQISLSKFYLQMVEIPRVFGPNLLFNLPNLLQALVLSLETDLRAYLAQIQAPCLLLWSRKDLTTPLTSGLTCHQQIAQSRLVTLEEGYHEWALLYPEKLVGLILDFIRQVEPISAPRVLV